MTHGDERRSKHH
jgi:hypothetical protein